MAGFGNNVFCFWATCQEVKMFTSGDTGGDSRADERVWFEAKSPAPPPKEMLFVLVLSEVL